MSNHASAISDLEIEQPRSSLSLLLLSALLTIFPASIVILELALFYSLFINPRLLTFTILCLTPYLLPLFLFRILQLFKPLKEGRSILTRQQYSPWVAAYRLQHVYILFPFLESILHAFPGAYSLWLRAWGSRVGKNIIWAGTTTVTDRSLLDIGDDVLIGNLVYLSPHVVNPSDGHLLLYLKKIRIGSNVFVGAGSRLGPGSVVQDNSFVPILTDLYLNQHFPKQKGADDPQT